MSDVYNKFLPCIPNGGHILDAGCGSGRDSLYFLEQGYKVEAFDLSIEMVKHAKSITGIDIKQMSFLDLDKANIYDGVWACASLLHVPNDILGQCVENCVNSLIIGGTMYCSFKYGDANTIDSHNRNFTNMTEETIKDYLPDNAKVIKIWTNEDVRKHKTQKWINILLERIV